MRVGFQARRVKVLARLTANDAADGGTADYALRQMLLDVVFMPLMA